MHRHPRPREMRHGVGRRDQPAGLQLRVGEGHRLAGEQRFGGELLRWRGAGGGGSDWEGGEEVGGVD